MDRIPSNDNNNSRRTSTARSFRLKDFFYLCLGNWIWFVVCLALTMGLAWLHLKRIPNVYTRTTSIMIKQENKNSTNKLYKELGISQGATDVNNEVLSLRAYELALKVAQRLNLDVNYKHEGFFHDDVLYGVNLPVKVTFKDLNDNERASMRLKLNADSTILISDMKLGGEKFDKKLKSKLGKEFKTPLGRISVDPSPYYKKGKKDNIIISRSPMNGAASGVRGRLTVNLRDKFSTIIDISYRDVSPSRAEDVLNTLISVYNENWVKDRNQITVSTNDFIKERLNVIEQELGSVDQNISSYKSAHLVPDVQQVGSMAMSQANATEQESSALSNQIYMVRYIRKYLADGQHDDRLLPSNSGLSSLSIGNQINEYNELLLARNNHLANSSLQNPLVVDLDQQLASMRHTIIQSLDNELAILEEQQRSLMSRHNTAVSRIASNPGQARDLLSVERQQKVKESLYLFLLQKREENELSQAFTAYNTRLIEPPHGSSAPTYPVPQRTYLYAFLIGLGLPAVFFFIKEALNTSVRSRKDLTQLKAPYVGDIPYVGNRENPIHLVKHEKEKTEPEILVKENSRNAINEAFRVIRTNLEFILGFDTEHRVIMLTSMHPNAGKTFIAANLSTAEGIRDKKVIAIDLDMRKASLSEYVNNPRHGVSNYLSGQEPDYRKLIVKKAKVDFLPCGTLPPNPTELLFVPKFEKLMNEVRSEYDYVFIDCPPIDIVADAAVINRYVDLTLFVIRSGMMDLAVLPEIDAFYEDKKFKNLCVILNGTETGSGYHKYGYGKYGYGKYGYGYSYGKTK